MDTRNNDDKFSIAADALLLLTGLQQAAELMVNETDNPNAPPYETTEANDEKYQKLHYVVFTLHASKLSEKRFYAASEWLNGVINRQRSVTKDDLDDWNNLLEFNLIQGINQVQLFVSHRRDLYFNTVLPAPVAAFPYAGVKQTMDDMLTASFTGWAKKSGQTVVNKSFADREDMFKIFYAISYIKRACMKIDEDFKMGFNVVESSGTNRHGICVNITNLEKAREMMGYNRPLLLLQSPSMARILAASSPVINRAGQGKDTSQPDTFNNNSRTNVL